MPGPTENCVECGHPAIASALDIAMDREGAQASMKEYLLLQVLGLGVTGGGIVAAIADSPLAAAVSIAIGIATSVTGLFGTWWNRNG